MAAVFRWWPPVLFGVAALLAWQVIVVVGGVPAFLLPAPTAIVTSIAARTASTLRDVIRQTSWLAM